MSSGMIEAEVERNLQDPWYWTRPYVAPAFVPHNEPAPRSLLVKLPRGVRVFYTTRNISELAAICLLNEYVRSGNNKGGARSANPDYEEAHCGRPRIA